MKQEKEREKEKVQEPERELSLEEAFSKIEEKIAFLEEEDISLEGSFRAYQDGMQLLKYCSEKIDRVEKKVLKISEDGGLDEF